MMNDHRHQCWLTKFLVQASLLLFLSVDGIFVISNLKTWNVEKTGMAEGLYVGSKGFTITLPGRLASHAMLSCVGDTKVSLIVESGGFGLVRGTFSKSWLPKSFQNVLQDGVMIGEEFHPGEDLLFGVFLPLSSTNRCLSMGSLKACMLKSLTQPNQDLILNRLYDCVGGGKTNQLVIVVGFLEREKVHHHQQPSNLNLPILNELNVNLPTAPPPLSQIRNQSQNPAEVGYPGEGNNNPPPPPPPPPFDQDFTDYYEGDSPRTMMRSEQVAQPYHQRPPQREQQNYNRVGFGNTGGDHRFRPYTAVAPDSTRYNHPLHITVEPPPPPPPPSGQSFYESRRGEGGPFIMYHHPPPPQNRGVAATAEFAGGCLPAGGPVPPPSLNQETQPRFDNIDPRDRIYLENQYRLYTESITSGRNLSRESSSDSDSDSDMGYNSDSDNDGAFGSTFWERREQARNSSYSQSRVEQDMDDYPSQDYLRLIPRRHVRRRATNICSPVIPTRQTHQTSPPTVSQTPIQQATNPSTQQQPQLGPNQGNSQFGHSSTTVLSQSTTLPLVPAVSNIHAIINPTEQQASPTPVRDTQQTNQTVHPSTQSNQVEDSPHFLYPPLRDNYDQRQINRIRL